MSSPPLISRGITSGIPLSAVLQGSGGPGPPQLPSPQRQGGITSGIPVQARGITSGIPNVQARPAESLSGTDLRLGHGGGITSGLPVNTGSITSGLPVISAASGSHQGSLAFSEAFNSTSPRSSPVHFSSAPSLHSSETEEKRQQQHLRQRLDLQPGSIPAESFTQMMQGLQASGSDTPPENFSRLLQSLQSPPTRASVSSGNLPHPAPGVAGAGQCYYDPLLCGAVNTGIGYSSGGSVVQGFLPPGATAPIVYQNLQMIREDSGDTPDPGEGDGRGERKMEADDDGGEHINGSQDGLYDHGSQPYREHRALTPTSSSELEQFGLGEGPGCQQKQRVKKKSKASHQYAGNPQISITDAQGHVTDVITTDPSSMEERPGTNGSLFCGEVASSFHGSTGVSSSVASQHGSAFTSQHHIKEQQQQQRLEEEQHRQAMQHYQKMLLQQLFNPSWINTHLASIPGPKPSAPSTRHGASSSFSPYPTSSSCAAAPASSACSSSQAQTLPSRPAPYSPSASITLGTSHNTVGSSLRHHHHHHHHSRSSSSRLRRQLAGGVGHHHFHPHQHHGKQAHHHSQSQQHHRHHHHSDATCDLYSSVSSSPTLQHQRGSPFFFSVTPHDDSYNPLGFMSLSSNRLSHTHSHNIPYLSNRAVSPTCFPPESTSAMTSSTSSGVSSLPPSSSVSMMVTSDDESVSLHYNSSSSDNSICLPSVTISAGSHSSPASVGCSPVTSPVPVISPGRASPTRPRSPIPVITSSPPSPTHSRQQSPSPSPSPPQPTSQRTSLSSSSSRPSSPSPSSSAFFPSLGPSPSSSSPIYGDCQSLLTSPFPTPANTPRPSICLNTPGSDSTTTTEDSAMEQDEETHNNNYNNITSTIIPTTNDNDSEAPPVLLEIRPRHPRRSVEEVLRAVKAALDSIGPQVDYQCSSDRRFHLNGGGGDLQMELEVTYGDGDGDAPQPGLQVRKLSGDNLEYAKLCNHLMACVNN